MATTLRPTRLLSSVTLIAGLLSAGCTDFSQEPLVEEELGEVQEAITAARYMIRAAHSYKCLDINGSGNGADAHTWTCFNGNNQKFNASDLGGNVHQILSVHEGRALEVEGSNVNDGANVQQWDNTGGNNKRWQVNSVGTSGGLALYNLRPLHDTGAALDINGANNSAPWNNANGADVQTWTMGGTGNANQKFYMHRVPSGTGTWNEDFYDGFDSFNTANWQDQILWVNNEDMCYVPNNEWNTREVSNGTLKLRVVDTGDPNRNCENYDKFGNKHYNTRYVAGRIASKNKKEFSEGKWTARIKLWTWKWSGGNGPASGIPGMFPAWWLLGHRNNEPPIAAASASNLAENVCWPKLGSGEIDIMEHYGSSGANTFVGRGIVDQNPGNGTCNTGDWQTYQRNMTATLDQWHEYSVELNSGRTAYDFRIDGVYQNNIPLGTMYPEPMFAILNYAKIQTGGMGTDIKEWVMEVDWVKHHSWY